MIRESTRMMSASPLALALAIVAGAGADAQETARPGEPVARRPDLTDPVVCFNVRGFRDFEPRDEPVLTRDEKLQIYYEPFNYLIVRDPAAGRYRAHLVQDIRIRRPGNQRPLYSLQGVIDYAPESREPPTSTFLLTTLSLKELPPGAYEVDLILRDRLADGSPETVQSVPFRVVESRPDARK